MSTREIRRAVYNCFASQPWIIQKYVSLRLRLIPLEDIFSRMKDMHGRVLSIGCGFGPFEIALALRRPDLDIRGSELSERRVLSAQKAAQGLLNVSFYAEDATTLVVKEKYNIIMMIDLLHHIPFESQEYLLREISEQLSDDAYLIIKDVGMRPYWKYIWNYFHDKIMTKGEKCYYRSLQDWKKMLEKMALQVSARELRTKQPYSHIMLIARPFNRE